MVEFNIYKTEEITAPSLVNKKGQQTLPNGYVVQQNDTFYSLSKKFNMDVEEFKKYTGTKELKKGANIKVPQEEIKTTAYSLAKKYNITLNELKILNPQIENLSNIKIGTKINVPIKPFGAETVTNTKSTESKSVKQIEQKSTKPKPAQPNVQTANTSDNVNGKQKIVLDNGKVFTAAALRQDAINSAKKDDEYKSVKNPHIVRPMPNIENGKIVAECELLHPMKINTGELKGKVIILNSGHGGYQQGNGAFDPGTIYTTTNAQGEKMPIEEWRVAQDYTEKLASKLRAKGANVIVVTGAVRNGGMAKQKYLEGLFAGNKGPSDVRKIMKNTSKSNMAFLSIHVESVKNDPSERKCSVKYKNGDLKDKQLANNINQSVSKGFALLTPEVGTQDLYVLNCAGKVQGVLIEIGNIANNKIQNSLLSDYDQNKYMSCVADAIVKTMK